MARTYNHWDTFINDSGVSLNGKPAYWETFHPTFSPWYDPNVGQVDIFGDTLDGIFRGGIGIFYYVNESEGVNFAGPTNHRYHGGGGGNPPGGVVTLTGLRLLAE